MPFLAPGPQIAEGLGPFMLSLRSSPLCPAAVFCACDEPLDASTGPRGAGLEKPFVASFQSVAEVLLRRIVANY
jgi:hypothetical protein